MRTPLSEIAEFLEQLAPADTALDWDNVGLQVGSIHNAVNSVLLALDVRPEVIEDAVEIGADLILTHHPLIFKPLKRIDFATPTGQMIRDLVVHNISMIALHTNLDRCQEGTGRTLAEKLGLTEIERYADDPDDEMNMVITGLFNPPLSGDELTQKVKAVLDNPEIRAVSFPSRVSTVAVIPGGGGSVIKKLKKRFDLVVTGDISYHDALDAEQRGQPVFAIGHFVSEKPVMDRLAKMLKERYPKLRVEVSEKECEPYKTL